MERLRLWRYKKLATENVKKKEVIEKPSDHEDYSSCFKLRKTLKVSTKVPFLILLFTLNATFVEHQLEVNKNNSTPPTMKLFFRVPT